MYSVFNLTLTFENNINNGSEVSKISGRADRFQEGSIFYGMIKISYSFNTLSVRKW